LHEQATPDPTIIEVVADTGGMLIDIAAYIPPKVAETAVLGGRAG
jgi:hypothetical protein